MRDVQDWLMDHFSDGGWFVEAGAHDGVGDSQTYRLEQAGWKGLCVEPSRAFKGLMKNRTCNVDNRCLAGHKGLVKFMELEGNGVELSGIVEHFGDHWERERMNHNVAMYECVGLTEMLLDHDMPAVIDFLNLDTEGSELVILQAHDFARFRFKTIQVEHNGVDHRAEALRVFLYSKNYTRIDSDGINDRYVLNTAADGGV